MIPRNDSKEYKSLNSELGSTEGLKEIVPYLISNGVQQSSEWGI